jgi:Mrp family chromosome partitioning ATPase
MKFTLTLLTLLTLALGVLSALTPQKAVIVTYPEDTPSSVVDQAMDAIKEAGGIITHEYKLIK